MRKIIKILAIISITFLFINFYFKKEKSPLENILPFSIFQIKTGSMIPTIQIGEIVISLKSKSYEKNDIITYKINSYFVTHRIIEITNEGYITKGDFNNTEDEKVVKKEQIQGKVIFHSKLLGKIYEYRYYLIIIVVFLLFI